ncbi:MAG: cellulase family glycosylhydrolase [Lentisphaerae bacterium]|jgi:hypothetical protein|nr:cellulase family glycosylhydrolase [Lentisphaerota bacterium]MBT5606590.1 cellulase family glycosylhydrolase [Lentisphaerota bacterium]MBT7056235.1 cellulase family glycosylhydrolase [Lentisphaerota bacterium]MBT7847394.1 cellulase family glycosylhydrolase [Lentisphaerota bacterium]
MTVRTIIIPDSLGHLFAALAVFGCAFFPGASSVAQSGTQRQVTTALPLAEPGPVTPVILKEGRFVNARTGALFTPFGVNYCVVGEFKTGKRGHATFSPSHYDRDFVGAMMRDLRDWGCNTVRVFHAYVAAADGIVTSREATELAPGYVANFLDFLAQARAHDIRVIVSFDVWGTGCPWLAERALPVDPEYEFPLETWDENYKRNNFQLCRTPARERANTIIEFIRAIRQHDPTLAPTILAWELENELNLHDDYPPFDGSLQTTAFGGRTFDLGDDAGRQAYLDAVFVNWCDYLRAAIRQEDPDALVSASVFTFAAVGLERPGFFMGVTRRDRRIPARPLALLDSGIDFVDIHSYVWRDLDSTRDELWHLRRNMESVEFDALSAKAARLGKPIIVGETGVHNTYTNRPGLSIPDRVKLGADYLHNHVRALRETYGVAGMLFWTYGTKALPEHGLYYDLNRQPVVRDSFVDAWLGQTVRQGEP